MPPPLASDTAPTHWPTSSRLAPDQVIMPLFAPILRGVPTMLAAADWLEAVLPILFVTIWIISQGVNIVRRLRGGDAGKAPPAPPGPAREPIRPVAATEGRLDPRGELERQIEAFRRGQQQAADDVSGPQSRPRPIPAAQAPRTGGTTPGKAPPRRAPSRSGQAKFDQPRAELRPASPPRLSRSLQPTPSDSAPPRLDEDSLPLAQRRLSSTPVGSFETQGSDITQHVNNAFSRELAHLGAGLGGAAAVNNQSAAAVPLTAAAELAALLRNPTTIRQVILLREVLERPIDRW